MTENPVCIAGAGMGGLAAALALQAAGWPVVVCEQAARLGEVGAGLHISPNGYKVLDALDLEATLERFAFRPLAVTTRHYRSGVPNFEGPFDDAFETRFGAPYLDLHRADLHRCLAEALLARAPGSIRTGARLVDVEASPDAVRVHFADGQSLDTPALIAADGVHSVVRSQLFDEPGARYTGHVAYRGIVRTEDFPVRLIEPKLNIWVGPGRHFVAYYIRNGELLNYVAIVEDAHWRTESWTSRAPVSELRVQFEDWHPAVRALIDQTVDEQCFRWALLVRDPLAAWSRGRVTLLGDAAHPMVPYLGQGANMAIEDGWVLAHCLSRSGDVAQGLRAYEQARLERTARVQAAAWQQGELNHAVGRAADGNNFHGGNFSDPSWIYGYDCVAEYPLPD